MSEAYGGREPLEEATREYVERLKEACPGMNERELYDLVYEIALRRVEEAEGPSGTASPEATMLRSPSRGRK